MPFWASYIVSELVTLLFAAGKEGLRMIIKVVNEVTREDKSNVKCLAKISSWETCLLYRHSLLMSQ